ncbi:RNA-binding protein 34-like isoform X1 [Herrania umbratica]|uniref:RNA-binding protein 34-like isoform X1 n=1 Tax=Herrania umbratica TaxID=108875 RepID=A0A6J0ZN32_9ROSI|nr:RNA-binding protein 34-like isoform X1 [Herrania umbratica]
MSEENPKQLKKRTALVMAWDLNVKAAVSEKLLHLLGDFNYNPDSLRVLTEYVVVLVSNGKCQSEVKSALEAFLGDSVTEFVSWLWDILSETSNDLNANMSLSDLENITGASSTEADASGKNQSQKCGSEAPKSHCQFSVFSNTLAEETNKDASTHSYKFNKNFGEFENNRDGSLAGYSFKTKPSAEILVADEQLMQYEKVHERSPPSKHCQETNVGRRRLFSKAAGAIFVQKGIKGTTRGNVWDRLGKRSENDTSVKVKKVKANEGDNIKKQMLEQNSPRLGQSTLIPTVQDSKINENVSGNCNVKTYRSNHDRKWQLNDFIPISGSISNSLYHEEEKSRKYRRQAENYTYMLKESGASCKSEKSKSYNKCCTSVFDASVSSRPEKISQETLSMEALESTQTLISHSACPATTGGTGPVQAQLVDMKLRLHQLETEISKLKSNPVNKDGKHALSSSFGSVDLLKEGVESRTVSVTNVHVAATQDALRSHFARCGAIIRVIKLTDTSTVKQKWSAYITFANKESVDKALALNGTNFFSRIIWVRKAGKQQANLLPACQREGSYLPIKALSQPSSTLAKELWR